MCGIAGLMGKFNPEILSMMSRSIAHRGPDDSSEILKNINENGEIIGLAHRRLAIIDLSPEGRQPMVNEDFTLYLVFNGEIYNFKGLRDELVSKGHTFRSRTDSEVLLHLYEEHGKEMLGRLNGIFALAIWDEKKQELFLARDGVGVKPLYYSETEKGFLFASEIKALMQTGEIPRELDLVAMHHYLAYLWAPAPGTMLKAVKKLEPGNAMLVRNGKIAEKWCYYNLPYYGDYLKAGEKELSELLREELENAVRRQMISDVPIGAFLSGGLDSSSIVAMMRKIEPDYIPNCYTIGFADGNDMEGSPLDLPYAQKIADHLGVNLKKIIMEPGDIKNLEHLIYLLDEPTADPAPINALLIAEQAKNDGIKVLMSGTGGDDIFSGYRRHQAIQIEYIFNILPVGIRKGIAGYTSRLINGQSNSGIMTNSLMRRFAKLFYNADASPELRLLGHFLWSSERMRRTLYSPETGRELDKIDTLEPLKNSLNQIPQEKNTLNRMLYLEGKHFLADHNLNYTDKTSMASGVEVRVPLLDLEIIKFAAQIPPNLKQKGFTGKYIFKKAMEPYLPREVIYRPKSGFGAPLRRWLRQELRPYVEDLLSDETLNKRGLFSPNAVRALIELDRYGKIDGAYTIFSLMCIELWCRIFIDKPQISAPGR